MMFAALLAADGTPSEALESVARECSPRVEVLGPREVVLDVGGLTRLFGDGRAIGEELRRTAADRGIRIRVAVAATRTAARLLVRHRAGVTVVAPGTEAAVVAPLPLSLLEAVAGGEPVARVGDRPARDGHVPPPVAPWPTDALRRWGMRTLGEFAALPAGDVAARLGQPGVEWQRLACADDPRPLVPALPEERFEQALDLEWPIDGLEPLSFVLARLMEPLEAHLARRDRGAAVLHVRLHLVDRTVHARALQLPAPMREARVLRTLALLDLESHPPAAAIDRVVVAVEPTPGRVVQFSLLTRALPSPERLSTLMARLAALMGEGRCGSPAAVDSWQPGASAMRPFAPRESTVPADHDTPGHRGRGAVPRVETAGLQPRIHHSDAWSRGGAAPDTSEALRDSASLWPVRAAEAGPVVALRRFRVPVPARVRVEDGRPVRVIVDRRGIGGGRVLTAAGPWRTSGAWWIDTASWNRDEWDVSLSDGATYRLFRDRDADAWGIDGSID